MRYYLLNRPPGIKTHPAGATRSRAWDVRHSIQSEHRHIATYFAWGWVEYDAPLSLTQCRRYDLLPADPREQAAYTFLEAANGDNAHAQALQCRYRAFTEEQLELVAEDNPILVAATRILAFGDAE